MKYMFCLGWFVFGIYLLATRPIESLANPVPHALTQNAVDSVKNSIKVRVNPYLTSSHMIQSNDARIQSLAIQITENSHTDKERAYAIFAWVAKHIRYDTEAYYKFNQNGIQKNYSALETLETRVAMCSGYANLNASLLRAVGIQTKIVYGENHAWNEVYLNGIWQTEDPTFGSGYLDDSANQFVPHFQPQYFTKSDMHKVGEINW